MSLAARPALAETHAGWQAELSLGFERGAQHTHLAQRRHRGPLLVQRAFYPEGDPCHVYVIHPPGGVVGGDQLRLRVSVGTGAHALLTTPAAGKFYRRGRCGPACLTQTLEVAAGATLEWLPQENIYYPDAAVELRTELKLAAGARCIGWELACLGLPANGLTLQSGCVRQAFELWCGEPLLLERWQLDRAVLGARWGLAGYSALGSLLAYPATTADLAAARGLAAAFDCAAGRIACTLVEGALLCRGFAARADVLKQQFVRLWQALRPRLLGREAVAPRIWAT